MGRTTATLKVTNDYDAERAAEGLIPAANVRAVELEAVVDISETLVRLPKNVIHRLGLPAHEHAYVGAGEAVRRTYSGARIGLCGRDFLMEVMESDEATPPVIGSLLLAALDLIVDLKTRRVIPKPDEDKWAVDCYRLAR